MKSRRTLLSVLLSVMLLGGAIFVTRVPVSAAVTTYTETINVYQISNGGTINWSHTYNSEATPEESATLTIVADDVDGPGNGMDGEQDAVYFNGHFLGYLNQMPYYTDFMAEAGPGNSNPDEITTTVFNIPLAYLALSMPASVTIETAWESEIETSTLVVNSINSESIDIKPWSDPNSINTKVNNDKNGVIPVAILGSADLDVEAIDYATLELHFGPELGVGGATPAHDINDQEVFLDHIVYPWVQSDPDGIPDSGDEIMVTANDDLIPDLVVHFLTKDTGFTVGDDYGYLWGEINGSSFYGVDAVRIVK
jgi:hypothetical protein